MVRRVASVAAAAVVLEEEAWPARRLVEAALLGDAASVEACLLEPAAPAASCVGVVSLLVRCAEVVLREEEADEVVVEARELKTDVSPLFAAAHAGHVGVVGILLAAGADVNQKLFRGYATTAAAREGNSDILQMLLKAGASQEACEEALLEACLLGDTEATHLLISSDMARPEAAAHALVTAASRGFVDAVTILLQNGVDINCMARVLLRSVKPALHANVDCTPLVAAIVSRQISTVKCLIKAGATTDCLVRVGAWSWDPVSGEELRVGACLGEHYNAMWCAVEYYESSGAILELLLQHEPRLLEIPHRGRTLLCHAILCQNPNAIKLLLHAGANTKFPISTIGGHVSFPLHLASRLDSVQVLKQLIRNGADINAKTSSGDTPLMISARAAHPACFLELITSGADLGLANSAGDTAILLAERSLLESSIVDILTEALNAGASVDSSDITVFSPLHFVAGSGRAEPLQMILNCSTENLNKLDGSGRTPVMVAAEAGNAETFHLLVMAGADIAATSAEGKSVMSILRSKAADDRDCFEQILLRALLADVIMDQTSFRPLHYAVRKGDTASLLQLLKMGHDANALDEDGYTSLMRAAAEGKSEACKILVSYGRAHCSLTTDRVETALSLARRGSTWNKATEDWLLNHVSSVHVLAGEELMKHRREGRDSPHIKNVRMLKSGVLTWGTTRRRNVACKEARAGPSRSFLKNREGTGESGKLIFLVVTVVGREIHFEASSTSSVDRWVRGINLIVKRGCKVKA